MGENQLAKQIGQLSELVKVDQRELTDLLKKNSLPNCSDAEFAFVVGLCNTFQLNPLTNEICFLRTKGGRLIPYVEYDGWVKIANRQPDYNGVEFTENFDLNGNFVSVTCKIHLKEKHPTVLTEYLGECQDKTKTPWVKYPIRMLRNKSFNQAIRTTFGISGIYDPDEAERIIEDAEIVPEPQKPELPKSKSETKAPEPKPEPPKAKQTPDPKPEPPKAKQTPDPKPVPAPKNEKVKPEYLTRLAKANIMLGMEFDNILKSFNCKSIGDIPDNKTAINIINKALETYDVAVGK